MGKATNARRKAAPVAVEALDGPTEAQHRNGDYARDTIIHAETARTAIVHVNRGGTPVMRWFRAQRLSLRQLAAIEWCQRLWHILDIAPPITAQYGAQIKTTGCADFAAVKWLAADEDLTRIRRHVSQGAWSTFENVCRFSQAAGVAGSELGFGPRSAEVRAHTIVCMVADAIIEREGL